MNNARFTYQLVFIFIAVLLCTSSVSGQQEQHYTQFIYNKLNLNPAYAGTKDGYCLNAIYRNQWLGIEGAPQTQVLNFHTALGYEQKNGIGLSLARHTIGISQSIDMNAYYAYHIKFTDEEVLSFGLNAEMRNYIVDFTDGRIVATQGTSGDASISNFKESKFIPNFGAGVYYQNDRFYVGLSVPSLLETSLDFEESAIVSKSVRHYYLMGGYRFVVSDALSLQPSFLVKYVLNAPIDADINLMGILNDKYTFGLTYRLGGNETGIGESLDMILAFKIAEKLTLGFSYDYTLSDIKDYSSGSVEVFIGYCIKKAKQQDIINPRFF